MRISNVSFNSYLDHPTGSLQVNKNFMYKCPGAGGGALLANARGPGTFYEQIPKTVKAGIEREIRT